MSRRRRRLLPAGALGAHFTQSFDVFVDPTIASTITGSPVSEIRDPRTGGFAIRPRFQQSTAGSRPAITASRLVHDGTADHLEMSAGYGTPTYSPLAETFNCDAGKGPTCTGAVRNSDGTWWVCHYGKKTEAGAGGETFDGGYVKYNAACTAVLKTVENVADLSLAGVGLQGLCFDPTDGTYFSVDAETDKIYHLDLDGETPSVIESFNFTNPNGIAYNTITDELLVWATTGVNLVRVNKDTGATIATLTGFFRDATNPDQLFFDASYGATGALWASSRGNPGRVVKYAYPSGVPLRAWRLTEVDSIEGIVVVGSTLYCFDDSYYHAAAAGENQLVAVPIDPSTPDYGTRLIIAGVAKILDSTPAATTALVTGGDGLGVAARQGVFLGYTTTEDNIRFILRNSAGNQAIVDWAAATTTDVEYLYYVDINMTAGTVSLYINGVLDSAEANANLTGTIPALQWTLCASYEGSGLPTRFCDATIGGFVVTTRANIQAEIEGRLNWGDPASPVDKGLLPAGHRYENAAPG